MEEQHNTTEEILESFVELLLFHNVEEIVLQLKKHGLDFLTVENC